MCTLLVLDARMPGIGWKGCRCLLHCVLPEAPGSPSKIQETGLDNPLACSCRLWIKKSHELRSSTLSLSFSLYVLCTVSLQSREWKEQRLLLLQILGAGRCRAGSYWTDPAWRWSSINSVIICSVFVFPKTNIIGSHSYFCLLFLIKCLPDSYKFLATFCQLCGKMKSSTGVNHYPLGFWSRTCHGFF